MFFMFEQKIISQNQKEKCKNNKYFTQWARGYKLKKGGAKSRTGPGPAQASHLQPSALFEQPKTRIS